MRLIQSLKSIPKKWHTNDNIKVNIMFLRHSIDSIKILENLHPKKEFEEVIYTKGALLWSAKRTYLTKTDMLKVVSSSLYKDMTVRNLNTTTKLGELMNEL